MIQAGEQAVWEFGSAVIQAEMTLLGLEVIVTVLDQGWDGETQQSQYRILKRGGVWEAAARPEGSGSAADWTELLPEICRLAPPSAITATSGSSAF